MTSAQKDEIRMAMSALCRADHPFQSSRRWGAGMLWLPRLMKAIGEADSCEMDDLIIPHLDRVLSVNWSCATCSIKALIFAERLCQRHKRAAMEYHRLLRNTCPGTRWRRQFGAEVDEAIGLWASASESSLAPFDRASMEQLGKGGDVRMPYSAVKFAGARVRAMLKNDETEAAILERFGKPDSDVSIRTLEFGATPPFKEISFRVAGSGEVSVMGYSYPCVCSPATRDLNGEMHTLMDSFGWLCRSFATEADVRARFGEPRKECHFREIRYKHLPSYDLLVVRIHDEKHVEAVWLGSRLPERPNGMERNVRCANDRNAPAVDEQEFWRRGRELVAEMEAVRLASEAERQAAEEVLMQAQRLARERAADEDRLAAEARGKSIAQPRHEALRRQKTAARTPLSLDLGAGIRMEFVWVEVLKGWVGKYQVTNEEYRQFKPDHNSGEYEGLSLNRDRQPAVQVSYTDAVAFRRWLQAKGDVPRGYRARLPDGNEWTTFAQCGDGRDYPWGNEWPPKYGNYADTAAKTAFGWGKAIDGYDDGQPVACLVELSGRNDWGLYGVGGNVEEWTNDVTEGDKEMRGVKGASWLDDDREDMRCSCRCEFHRAKGTNCVGFRVVVLRRAPVKKSAHLATGGVATRQGQPDTARRTRLIAGGWKGEAVPIPVPSSDRSPARVHTVQQLKLPRC